MYSKFNLKHFINLSVFPLSHIITKSNTADLWTYTFNCWVNPCPLLSWRVGWVSSWASPFSCTRSCREKQTISMFCGTFLTIYIPYCNDDGNTCGMTVWRVHAFKRRWICKYKTWYTYSFVCSFWFSYKRKNKEWNKERKSLRRITPLNQFGRKQTE